MFEDRLRLVRREFMVHINPVQPSVPMRISLAETTCRVAKVEK